MSPSRTDAATAATTSNDGSASAATQPHSQVESLIRGLLCIDPFQRLSADDVLSHPWLESHRSSLPSLLLSPIAAEAAGPTSAASVDDSRADTNANNDLPSITPDSTDVTAVPLPSPSSQPTCTAGRVSFVAGAVSSLGGAGKHVHSLSADALDSLMQANSVCAEAAETSYTLPRLDLHDPSLNIVAKMPAAPLTIGAPASSFTSSGHAASSSSAHSARHSGASASLFAAQSSARHILEGPGPANAGTDATTAYKDAQSPTNPAAVSMFQFPSAVSTTRFMINGGRGLGGFQGYQTVTAAAAQLASMTTAAAVTAHARRRSSGSGSGLAAIAEAAVQSMANEESQHHPQQQQQQQQQQKQQQQQQQQQNTGATSSAPLSPALASVNNNSNGHARRRSRAGSTGVAVLSGGGAFVSSSADPGSPTLPSLPPVTGAASASNVTAVAGRSRLGSDSLLTPTNSGILSSLPSPAAPLSKRAAALAALVAGNHVVSSGRRASKVGVSTTAAVASASGGGLSPTPALKVHSAADTLLSAVAIAQPIVDVSAGAVAASSVPPVASLPVSSTISNAVPSSSAVVVSSPTGKSSSFPAKASPVLAASKSVVTAQPSLRIAATTTSFGSAVAPAPIAGTSISSAAAVPFQPPHYPVLMLHSPSRRRLSLIPPIQAGIVGATADVVPSDGTDQKQAVREEMKPVAEVSIAPIAASSISASDLPVATVAVGSVDLSSIPSSAETAGASAMAPDDSGAAPHNLSLTLDMPLPTVAGKGRPRRASLLPVRSLSPPQKDEAAAASSTAAAAPMESELLAAAASMADGDTSSREPHQSSTSAATASSPASTSASAPIAIGDATPVDCRAIDHHHERLGLSSAGGTRTGPTRRRQIRPAASDNVGQPFQPLSDTLPAVMEAPSAALVTRPATAFSYFPRPVAQSSVPLHLTSQLTSLGAKLSAIEDEEDVAPPPADNRSPLDSTFVSLGGASAMGSDVLSMTYISRPTDDTRGLNADGEPSSQYDLLAETVTGNDQHQVSSGNAATALDSTLSSSHWRLTDTSSSRADSDATAAGEEPKAETKGSVGLQPSAASPAASPHFPSVLLSPDVRTDGISPDVSRGISPALDNQRSPSSVYATLQNGYDPGRSPSSGTGDIGRKQ